jgi:hypothetical protein
MVAKVGVLLLLTALVVGCAAQPTPDVTTTPVIHAQRQPQLCQSKMPALAEKFYDQVVTQNDYAECDGSVR